MCGTNGGAGTILVNGNDLANGAGGGLYPPTLWINGGSHVERSDFAIAELIIWDRALSPTEMRTVSDHFASNVIGMVLPPSLPPPSTPPSPSPPPPTSPPSPPPPPPSSPPPPPPRAARCRSGLPVGPPLKREGKRGPRSGERRARLLELVPPPELPPDSRPEEWRKGEGEPLDRCDGEVWGERGERCEPSP